LTVNESAVSAISQIFCEQPVGVQVASAPSLVSSLAALIASGFTNTYTGPYDVGSHNTTRNALSPLLVPSGSGPTSIYN